jgi:hypothetical protein
MTAKKTLSRADILKANDVKTKEVPVPVWGGSVFVASMTAGQRDAYEAMLFQRMKDGGRDNIVKVARASLAVACCVDASGAPLFTDEDLELLSRKSAAALDRVVKAAQELNKLGDAEVEALGNASASDPSAAGS